MRSRWAFAAAAVLTATAAVAIATTTGGGETSTTSAPSRPSVALGERAAREALALWDRFPAGAKPRPIVIPFSRGIVNAPRSQHEDLALYHATWKLMAPRATDLAVARHYHWISAAAATIALRSDLKHRPTPSSKLTVHVLLGRASFVTDRGRRDLPAWEFSFGRFREPASVLAIVPFSAPAPRSRRRRQLPGRRTGSDFRRRPNPRDLVHRRSCRKPTLRRQLFRNRQPEHPRGRVHHL